MFKVILTGKIEEKPVIKFIEGRKVCNFTVYCKNNHDKINSSVRCSIWGSKADEFMKHDVLNKIIYIEGDGTNRLNKKENNFDNYIFNVNCISYQILF